MKTDHPPVLSRRKIFLHTINRSQGVVEFAIALPILLTLLFGIIDFSLLFSSWLLIQNMSRQAVRYAVTGEYNASYCTSGCTSNTDEDQARLHSIRDVAQGYEVGLLVNHSAIVNTQPGYIYVTVCSSKTNFTTDFGVMGSPTHYNDCYHSDDPLKIRVEDPGGAGDEVVVMIDFNYPFVTPFLNQIWPQMHLVSAQRGLVEQFRVARLITTLNAISVPSPTASDTLTATETFTSTHTYTPTSTATATHTETSTPTPTATATPDCSQFYFNSGWSLSTTGGKPRVTISLWNNTLDDTYIQNLTFDWGAYDATNPTQVLKLFNLDGVAIYNFNTGSSPASWVLVGSPTASHTVSHQASSVFTFDYANADAGWPGSAYATSFGLSVHMGNECDVSIVPQPTPTSTPTVPSSTPSRTFTPSNTRTATATVPSLTPSKTFTPTNTVPSSTPSKTRTPTNSRTPTPVVASPTASNTRTRTSTRTLTPTVPTLTPSNTYTRTATVPSLTPSNTYTRTATVPSLTPSKTSTLTPTVPTPTNTSSPTRTPTRTLTPTNTAVTPTRTFTATVPTFTPTETICPTCYGFIKPGGLFIKETSILIPNQWPASVGYFHFPRFGLSPLDPRSN